ncbi:MAG TPA: alkyl sulfatase C-terminal domain-containing protein [Jatrophihabitans sp.]|nr:alkyl sulfatase C-terminal domain-containing protein [Jatrophihabitans sp.]
MATADQCEQALHELAARLAAKAAGGRTSSLDRSLNCALDDLGVGFSGRLKDGQLIDITREPRSDAQIRLTMSSDDLLALVAGEMKLAAAWASGRVKVDASMRDLLKLRSIF